MTDMSSLYGSSVSPEEARKRFRNLAEEHERLFGTSAEYFFSASGRTELGGNHTDHNLGNVLAASVSLDTIAAVHGNDDYTVTIMSRGYPAVQVDISNLNPEPSERGTTDSLVRGVAASIASHGGFLGGFTANVESNIFSGSGLSSSASIEILIGTIFNCLFNNSSFSTTDLAVFGQAAERDFFGKPCGLMDQIACANGGAVGIDFKNQSKPLITPVSVDLEHYGYALAVVNTGGSHADLTPDYAAIPAEMKKCASYFSKNVMGQVELSDFEAALPDLRKAVGNDRALLRAYHFLTENKRAREMLQCLRAGDFDSYLALVKESGLSSVMYLQNIYSPSDCTNQGISYALAVSSMISSRIVSRVHGGGFAGTIQSYVPLELADIYKDRMESVFGSNSCIMLSVRNAPACIVEI